MVERLDRTVEQVHPASRVPWVRADGVYEGVQEGRKGLPEDVLWVPSCLARRHDGDIGRMQSEEKAVHHR